MSINRVQPDTTLPKEPKIKIYRALLTQSSTNNPTIIILQNTIGATITIPRINVGYYEITATGEFLTNKTYATCSSSYNSIHGISVITRQDNNILILQTINLSGANSDGILNGATLEIMIYE